MAPSYPEYVRALSLQQPELAGLSAFLCSEQCTRPIPPVQCLDLAPSSPSVVQETPIPFPQLVSDILSTRGEPQASTLCRVAIIRDISPYMVSQLGSLLDVHPLFFASHISTCFPNLENSPPPPLMMQAPSASWAQDCAHIHYQRVVDLGLEDDAVRMPYSFRTSGNAPRSVRCLPSMSNRRIGLVRSCCSVLRLAYGASQIALILVDDTSQDFAVPVQLKGSAQYDGCLSIPQASLHGGELEAGGLPSYSHFCSQQGQSRTRVSRARCISDGIARHYHGNLDCAQGSRLSISFLTYPLLGQALREWRLYSLTMCRYLKLYEYSFRNHSLRLDDDIVELQRWRRRAKQSLHKLFLTREFISRATSDPARHSSGAEHEHDRWEALLLDFQYVADQIADYSRSFEAMLPVAAMKLQMMDTKLSIAAAVNVKYLTYAALVFAPLSFVSSLFSMSEPFLPGRSGFSTYLAVAIPMVLGVLGVSTLLPLMARSCLFEAWWAMTTSWLRRKRAT